MSKSKEKSLKLKCQICKVSKTNLGNFIVKNNLDNTYLEVKDFIIALKIFGTHEKKNRKLYSEVINAFFNSNIYFCSKKCYGIYNVKK